MKRRAPLITSLILVAFICVGVTLAWIVDSSNTVTNGFTVGKVQVTLSESTGNSYKLVPGITLDKNPTATVKADSESCWLFIKIEKSGNPDTYITYDIENGWTSLDGYVGVYYREVEKSNNNQTFAVLKNNTVKVKDTVTEEMLNSINATPKLNFSACAIQKSKVASAQEAWTTIQTEREE